MLFIKELRQWNENNRTIARLNKMSARQLSDIGIERSQIKSRIRSGK